MIYLRFNKIIFFLTVKSFRNLEIISDSLVVDYRYTLNIVPSNITYSKVCVEVEVISFSNDIRSPHHALNHTYQCIQIQFDKIKHTTLHPKVLTTLMKYFYFSGHDCSIRLWNLDSKTCVQEITAHRKKFDESIHAVSFHPSKPYIASAGADALAKVFV